MCDQISEDGRHSYIEKFFLPVQEIGGVTNQGTKTQETKDMATIALPREETPGHLMIGHSGAEEGWTPAVLSRQNGDSYLQNQARISSRGSSTLPAGKSASHTEPDSTTTKGLQTNESWWDPARRPSILAAASLPHCNAAVRAIERQGELSSQPPTVLGMADAGAVWPEEPAPEYGNRISGENNIAANSGTNRGLCLQPPTFHEDGRLEAAPKRVFGSFEAGSGGDTTWRTGGGETSSISGGATGGCWSQQGGIDAEVATTGLSWSRESGGEDDQRQVRQGHRHSRRLERPRAKSFVTLLLKNGFPERKEEHVVDCDISLPSAVKINTEPLGIEGSVSLWRKNAVSFI